MPRHLQTTQFLRYRRDRSGASARADNADVEGHAVVCRRARKGNIKGLSCAQYKGVNIRSPNLRHIHLRNHRYDPTALESEQARARGVINTWMASYEDDAATAVATALSDAGASGVSAILEGNRPIGAEALHSATLAHSQTDVPWEHIESSLRKWRVDTDLATRLNCPYCKGWDTNAHYLHFCTDPTVAAAR